MTPEEAQQAQTIAEAKERIQWAANCRHVLTYTAKRNEFAVLKRRAKKFQRIIDSQAQKIAELQARARKQYTEAELREGFASQYQDGLHVGENGEFTDRQIEADFAEWVECARFLGAIKDTHAEPIT